MPNEFENEQEQDLSLLETQPEEFDVLQGEDDFAGSPADAPIESNENTEKDDKQRIEDLILSLAQSYDKEDVLVRNAMLAFWKKLDLYFHGIQRIFWQSGVDEWGRIDGNGNQATLDSSMYDKIINIYRAHGESIISALSIKLPTVNYVPDDADVAEDIDTANAYSRIAELIQKHNESPLVFMRALYILFNQGVVASYTYNVSDREFGTFKVPVYGEDVTVTTTSLNCPVCGGNIEQYQIKGQTSPIEPVLEVLCPSCQSVVEPIPDVIEELIPQITGYNDEPKSRTIIDVFGPMYAMMPFYARRQKDLPYLNLRFEQHNAMLKSMYPSKADKIGASGNDLLNYDRWARTYSDLQDVYTQSLTTVNCRWFRPWAFYALSKEDADFLKAKFPKGLYTTYITNCVLEFREEELDKHWAISHHPLSDYIHADPIGKPLAPVQELRNEADDLSIETFRHSIPETYADPEVLDFDKYSQENAAPGMVYPATPAPGQRLSDSFHSSKVAALTDELKGYISSLDADGQFVSGSFPSIYGGPSTGSKTATEYERSRGQALQRLNISWTMLKYWWAHTISNAIPIYIKAMVEDEKFVKKAEGSSTGFVNVWIKKAELVGKVGSVEPEASEELPTSFSAIKGVLMELMTLNSDPINLALFSPENAPIITKALGITNFFVPGEDDRNKQYSEFQMLLQSPPLPDGSPSVSVELDVDDHQVHIMTCKSFLVSPTGMAAQQTNPEGYANIVAHLKQHQAAEQMLAMQNAAQAPAGEGDENNQAVEEGQ